MKKIIKKLAPPPRHTKPIRTPEDVEKSRDNRIDQDFPGYPHAPSKEELINPKTNNQRKTANAPAKK